MKLVFVIDEKRDLQFVSGENFRAAIKGIHKNSKKYLENAREMYQRSWNEVNDKFSDYIEKITGYKWFYKKYECVVSAVHPGLTNWGYAPKVVRQWRENPYYMRMITAHELIMSHYFEIIKRHYKEERLTDFQIWVIAEIAAFEIRQLPYLVKNFWPWEEFNDPFRHNHTNLIPLQKALTKIFPKRKDFDDYIKQGIKLVKRKYPDIAPLRFKK